MADPSAPLESRVLDGRYRIIRVLGQGAMGTVYVARQLSTGIDRALKLVRAEHRDNPGRQRRFEREAEIIARLRDPNTVQLIDKGHTAEGQLYLVSELLDGETLGARLARGPLTVDATLAVMAAVSNALREAHGLGVVHRDIKPENIFLATLGHREIVKVLDFGVARLAGASTTTGNVIGTAAYMAPEQALARRVDGRADLYSLGVVAYECLAGQRPFAADNPAVLLHAHAFSDPPPLGPRAPHAPKAVVDLVMRLLEKAPDARLPDAAGLGAAVAALQRDREAAVVGALDPTATLDAPPDRAPAPSVDPATADGRAGRRIGVAFVAAALSGAVWWASSAGEQSLQPAAADALAPPVAVADTSPPADAALPLLPPDTGQDSGPVDAAVDARRSPVDARPRPTRRPLRRRPAIAALPADAGSSPRAVDAAAPDGPPPAAGPGFLFDLGL